MSMQTMSFGNTIRNNSLHPPTPIIMGTAYTPLSYHSNPQTIYNPNGVRHSPTAYIPSQASIVQPNIIYHPPNRWAQTVPIVRHPQHEINLNFDYESANFLCETKIEEQTIYCVLCKENYKTGQKDKHLERHKRKKVSGPINEQKYLKLQGALVKTRKLISKPIVEPEQYNIQYDPNTYNLVKNVQYNDLPEIQKKSVQIDASSHQHQKPKFQFQNIKKIENEQPNLNYFNVGLQDPTNNFQMKQRDFSIRENKFEPSLVNIHQNSERQNFTKIQSQNQIKVDEIVKNVAGELAEQPSLYNPSSAYNPSNQSSQKLPRQEEW